MRHVQRPVTLLGKRLCYDSLMPDHSHRKRKRAKGQFFTVGNPFVLTPFRDWFRAIPLIHQVTLLEPFAGANNIVALMRQAGYDNAWACFDIDPPAARSHGQQVVRRDTFKRCPKGYQVAITNPPYLARHSASRHKLPYPDIEHDDLYKHALEVLLTRVPYVAAIVPESFINAGLFHDRLHSVVTLTTPMFEDTDHPVCLALFSPRTSPLDSDFILFSDNARLGNYQELSSVLRPLEAGAIPWKFNDPQGQVGLRGVDNARTASIAFVPGHTIPSSEIKHASRLITRISGIPEDISLKALLDETNALLADYRAQTHDAMLTSFKGLREDGAYRRRLDFRAARHLLDHAVARLRKA